MKLAKSLLIIAFLSIVFASTAFADDRADAMRLIDSGNSAYDAGEFRDALKDYQKAYSLTEDPRLLYRIGITFENLANYQRARELLEMFILAEPSSKYAGRVKKKITNLRKLEGTLQATIKVSSSPSGGSVFLNEDDIATAKPIGITPLSIPVGPGSHTVVVQLKGYEAKSVNLTLKEGEKLEKAVTLQKVGGAPEPVKKDPVKLPTNDPVATKTTEPKTNPFGDVTRVDIAPPPVISALGYIGFGLGIVALGAASVLSAGDSILSNSADPPSAVPWIVTGIALVGGSSYFLWFHDWNDLPASVGAVEEGSVVGFGYRTEF